MGNQMYSERKYEYCTCIDHFAFWPVLCFPEFGNKNGCATCGTNELITRQRRESFFSRWGFFALSSASLYLVKLWSTTLVFHEQPSCLSLLLTLGKSYWSVTNSLPPNTFYWV